MRFPAVFLAFAVTALAQQPQYDTLRKLSADTTALSAKLHSAIVLIRSEAFEPVSKDSQIAIHQTGAGSGVIISADGYIVTNAHVVGKAPTVEVLLAPPAGARSAPEHNRTLEGRVVGRDTEADVALVKVDATGLQFLQWGDSEALAQGQLVLAIGNPMGLENSVTLGIVSAPQRQLETDSRMVYIQTDASINPGNSGGALVDLNGKLIGINTLILSRSGGSEGLGFAVPARIAQPIADQLRDHGKVIRGDIGVTAQTLTYGIANGLSLQRDTGVLVADVVPKSTGDIAGIQPGDIILAVDGRTVETARQFHVLIYRKPVAGLTKIQLLRGAETKTLDVVVVDRAEKSPNLLRLSLGPDNLIRKLRILGAPLDEKLLSEMPPLRKTYGILVAAMVPGVVIQENGLMPGDVIHAINTKAIATLKDAHDILAPIAARARIVLQIERDSKTKFIEYQLE